MYMRKKKSFPSFQSHIPSVRIHECLRFLTNIPCVISSTFYAKIWQKIGELLLSPRIRRPRVGRVCPVFLFRQEQSTEYSLIALLNAVQMITTEIKGMVLCRMQGHTSMDKMPLTRRPVENLGRRVSSLLPSSTLYSYSPPNITISPA
jgi:hypothetical protein